MNPAFSRFFLNGLALFAMGWAVARAYIQSITIDEAFTYIMFVARPRYWRGEANNHVLNTALMGLFTGIFGASDFSARLPALIGAAFYIGACYRLCRLLSASNLLQCALFTCLVFNPFIFDFLVAARGYGLAIGFLMSAVVCITAWYLESRSDPATSLNAACAWASLFVGLSVASNLAFAFVDAVALSAITLFALSQSKTDRRRLFISLALPCALVVLAFPAYPVLHWREPKLIYGTTTLRVTLESILNSSLYQTSFDKLKPIVFPAVGLTTLMWCLFLVFAPKERKVRPHWLSRFALFIALVIVLTVTIHWLGFQLFGLLLPQGRTAIYLFPLGMSIVGALAAIPSHSRSGQWLRGSLIGSLVLMGSYFLFCLRLDHFKEWQWDADVRETYSVLDCLNRTNGIKGIASAWSYQMPLNFYRIAKHSSLPEIVDETWNREDIEIFAVDTAHTPDVIARRALEPFYHGKSTGLVLAADPELAQTLRAGSCVAQ